MSDTHYATILTVGCTTFGVLVVVLGFLVRATIKWTVASVKIDSIEKTVVQLTTQLVQALTRDNDFETRIQLLERGHK